MTLQDSQYAQLVNNENIKIRNYLSESVQAAPAYERTKASARVDAEYFDSPLSEPNSAITKQRSIQNKASHRSMVGDENSQAGQLKIENDRLQTTIMILNQKLKSQNDSDQQIGQLRKKNKEHEDEKTEMQKQIMDLRKEISALQSDKSNLQCLNEQLETRVKTLSQTISEKDQEHDRSEDARKDLKIDLEELNNKLTSLEEELYDSKTTQLDLLEQLKELEFQQ